MKGRQKRRRVKVWEAKGRKVEGRGVKRREVKAGGVKVHELQGLEAQSRGTKYKRACGTKGWPVFFVSRIATHTGFDLQHPGAGLYTVILQTPPTSMAICRQINITAQDHVVQSTIIGRARVTGSRKEKTKKGIKKKQKKKMPTRECSEPAGCHVYYSKEPRPPSRSPPHRLIRPDLSVTAHPNSLMQKRRFPPP